MYYKPINKGKEFMKYQCVFKEKKKPDGSIASTSCKRDTNVKDIKITSKNSAPLPVPTLGYEKNLGELMDGYKKAKTELHKQKRMKGKQTILKEQKQKLTTTQKSAIKKNLKDYKKEQSWWEWLTGTRSVKTKVNPDTGKISNVGPGINKRKMKILNKLSCEARGREGLGEVGCEIGNQCWYDNKAKKKHRKCRKKFKWNERFQGQPIPIFGDDCVSCDMKGTQCNHVLIGWVSFLAFLIYGIMLIPFGIEFKKNIEEDDEWQSLGSISIGMGCIYVFCAVGIFFFTLYCPEGSDWSGPDNDFGLAMGAVVGGFFLCAIAPVVGIGLWKGGVI
jgi:hypothetical protein